MPDAAAESETASLLSPFRVLDLTDERGHLCGAILAQMGADVIAVEPPEGSSARRLGYEALAEVNPELVYVSISPFGSDGPKADWAVSDLTLQASAVNMAMTGDSDRAPLRTGGVFPQAFHNAAGNGHPIAAASVGAGPCYRLMSMRLWM